MLDTRISAVLASDDNGLVVNRFALGGASIVSNPRPVTGRSKDSWPMEGCPSLSSSKRRHPVQTQLAHFRAFSVALFVISLMGCAAAPIQEMSDARQAVRAARQADAGRHAPGYLHQAEKQLQDAEQALNDGARGYKPARDAAVAAKDAAMKGRTLAVAIGAAKAAVAEAVAAGALSAEAESALRNAVAAARVGDDARATELAHIAKQQAEADLAEATP